MPMSYASSLACHQCLHTGGLDDADMNENIRAALAALLRARRTNCTRRQRKPHRIPNSLIEGSSAWCIKEIVHRALDGAALQFWARSGVLPKKVGKLPCGQLASHNALAVMPCCPLGRMRCGHGR